MTQLTLDVPGKLTTTGMELTPGKLTYEKWEYIGTRLRELNHNSRWWLGDWVLYGETYLPDKYSQALEATDYDRETLRGFAYVCERFDHGRRRESEVVTWSHHRVVAPLPPEEADEWLDKVEAEGWTVKELKREMRKAKRGDVEEPGPPEASIGVAFLDPDEKVGVGGHITYDGVEVRVLAYLGVTTMVLDEAFDKGFQDQRVFVVATGDEYLDPDRLTPAALADFFAERLEKELGL